MGFIIWDLYYYPGGQAVGFNVNFKGSDSSADFQGTIYYKLKTYYGPSG